MAGEIPEDIVEIGLKCIICSKPCVNQKKIHIFGNCSARWPEIILQSLDVDLSCYANYCELIFCKAYCSLRNEMGRNEMEMEICSLRNGNL